MKKALTLFSVLFAIQSMGLFSIQAADAPIAPAGISRTSTEKDLPTPGLSSVSADVKAATPKTAGNVASQAPTAANVIQEPVAKEKKGSVDNSPVQTKKKKYDRKEYEKSLKEKRARMDAEEAVAKDLAEAPVRQVQAMRKERATTMPYLDRMYIQTQITPLKMQQKDEFLQGGPKNLKDLLVRARSVHTKAKADYENIALYNRRVLAAFRKLFPEASLDLNNRKGSLSNQAYTGEDWQVSLRQPIFDGGILWNTFLQEKSNLEASRKMYDKTLAELLFDISKAYYEYQRTLQTVEEHKAMVEKMKRFAEMSEEKFKQKLISEIEHLNVQSLYSQMQFDLESANQELEIAELDLQKYLDLSVNDEISVAKVYDLNAFFQSGKQGAAGSPESDASVMLPGIFRGDEKAPALSKMIDISYGHRPELQVEAAKLQAQRLGEKVRWGEFLPKAFLTYEFGGFGEAYQNSYAQYVGLPASYKTEPDLKNQWRLLLEMNWNVGGNKVSYNYERNQRAPSLTEYESSGGSNVRKNGVKIGVLDGLDAFVNVKQAEVDKLNQVVELEKAEKQVLQDVKQAYYDYQKAVIQVRSTVKRLEYRKRLRDYAEYKVLNKREGAELSELLQAETDLTREKSDLHKALKDYFSAQAALDHAVGVPDLLASEASGKK